MADCGKNYPMARKTALFMAKACNQHSVARNKASFLADWQYGDRKSGEQGTDRISHSY